MVFVPDHFLADLKVDPDANPPVHRAVTARQVD
jgi:hypothetical protein